MAREAEQSSGVSGGCYSLPWGPVMVGADSRLIDTPERCRVGEPPRCCTRVEVAVDPYAGGCLGIGASVAARVNESLDTTPARVESAAAVLRHVEKCSVTVAPTRP